MGSKGRVLSPSHLRHPLPGPRMLHPDPFGPGVHPPPGSFPLDVLPHPEIMEHKLAAQDVEMQRILRENQRLAATLSVLRRELAGNQQELQRMDTHMGAMKDEQDKHMRGLLDKIAMMAADLKASETVKVELQQAHAEAHSLMVARQDLMAKAQKLNQDIQKSHAGVQAAPALMSELNNINQEYQHCRAIYDYEKKLHSDHYESLQVMEKNYNSMMREIGKLRTELSNAANLDKSGGSYSNSGGYKENDTAGQHSVGQNAYEDAYGVPQGRAPSGGGSAGNAPARTGYDAPVRGGPANYTSRNTSHDAPRAAAGHDNSKGAPKGGPGDAAANKAAVGTQVPVAAGNIAGASTQTASPYGSAQATSPNGSAQAPYGLNPYGSAQVPYGLNPYGSVQAPNHYGSTHAPNLYGSTQALKPYGSTQAPNTYGSTQAPNPYGSTQASKPYGSTQASNSYGSGQPPNPCGSTQAPNPYGST